MLPTQKEAPPPENPKIKSAVLAGLFFGFCMSVTSLVTTRDAVASAVTGLISGLFFSMAMYVMTAAMERRLKTDLPVLPFGEKIIHSGLANHFRSVESVGGRLYLTTERIIFIPHALNIQKGDFSLSRTEIKEARTVRTWGLIPNGLQLTENNGKTHSFVVYEPKIWVERINASIEKLQIL